MSQQSWKNYTLNQQPQWPNTEKFNSVLSELRSLPALTFAGEIRALKKQLKSVHNNKSFIVQMGNCAETFAHCNGPTIHNFLRIFLLIGDILEKSSQKKIIKIGRIAGQYAKPRSQNYEVINSLKIPVYRGDNVNSTEPTIESRIPDPDRLLKGYYTSAATLNLIRAFTQGRYESHYYKFDWSEHLYKEEINNNEKYKKFIEFLRLKNDIKLKRDKTTTTTYTSHEALLLDYEQAFTRIDTIFGDTYNLSAHFLWLGNRTRSLDSAHVEYLKKIDNPIGIKIGGDFDEEEFIQVIKKINHKNELGKIVIITRFGSDHIDSKFPPLISAIQKQKLNVIWMVDPMHGNTFTHNGKKIRDLSTIKKEIKSFFKICNAFNIIPGGVHLEATTKFVTECINCQSDIKLIDLETNYTTHVDPQLNAAQSIEIALEISNLLK